MNAEKAQLYSVSEAAKALDVSKSTLHTHMAKRRLNPVQPVDQRDPAGARLDVSDLVVVSCFKVLRRHGLTWRGLDTSGQAFLAAVWVQHEAVMPPELKGAWETSGIGKRVFQAFFEQFNYRVFLVAVTLPEQGTYLVPLKHGALTEFMDSLSRDRQIGSDGIVIIDVEAHYTALLEKLAGVK